ncbi:helix-turn-helix transcriptional regulator [Bosea sp. RAF48]|uniref:helix-turn-helix transcriptional regulator n=1 Tax=Bosea sp. RAF48 TaxID=3237480 RepID=UPI003F929A15
MASNQISNSAREFYTTRHLPIRDQMDGWRQLYRNTFDISLGDGVQAPFPADHTTWHISLGLRLTRAAMPEGLLRHWKHFSPTRLDDWLVVVVPEKAERPVQFRSLTSAFEGVGRDGEVLTLYLSRDSFRRHTREFEALPQGIERNGMLGLFADYLIALERMFPTIPAASLPLIEQATRDLILASLAPTKDRITRAERPLDRLLLDRARDLARSNIGASRFGPDKLGEALGVSRSRLYRMFEPFGGVAKFLADYRLAEARRRLLSSDAHVAIQQIAFDVGFTDYSTFSRAFKRKYGYAPRDTREQGDAAD